MPAFEGSQAYLAQSWEAIQPSNELLALYNMNRSKNISDFESAIIHFKCPAQNFAYIDQSNNIAIWGQGSFKNKWPNQGRFVMRGDTSATQLGSSIPFIDVPKVVNPSTHWVGSANQLVVSEKYSYWISGNFSEFRSWDLHCLINKRLSNSDSLKNSITVDYSKELQLSNFSILALNLKDSFLKTAAFFLEDSAVNVVKKWDCYMDATSEVASLFHIWFNKLHVDIWKQYLPKLPIVVLPKQEITMQLIQGKINQKYWDIDSTKTIESYNFWSNNAFKFALDSLASINNTIGNTQWYQIKKTAIQHLTKLPAFGYYNLINGGWGNTLNAMKSDHGPSWRMIVTFEQNKPKAEVVYPGGQSGNPGSKNYNAFIATWNQGAYYTVDW